jgi:hypothetical protein
MKPSCANTSPIASNQIRLQEDLRSQFVSPPCERLSIVFFRAPFLLLQLLALSFVLTLRRLRHRPGIVILQLPVSRGNYLVIESGGTGVFFSMSFNQLGLSAELLRSVTRQGYQQPTPIQQRVIPLILEVAGLRSGDRFRNAQSPHPSGMRA